jgi:hypothetical protein
MMESRRMRLAGHVAQMGMRRNAYIDRLLVGKPEEKRLLGRPIHRWKDNIKIDLIGQRWPTGSPRAGYGPRLYLLWPPPSHWFIFSGLGVIEGNKIDWRKFKYLLNIIGAT